MLEQLERETQFVKICDIIGYEKGFLECWDCLSKRWLQYHWKMKWLEWTCEVCGCEWKDIGLKSWNIENNYHYPKCLKEILFSPSFMKALVTFLDKKNLLWEKRNYDNIWKEIIYNLDNPIWYVYKLVSK